MEKFTRYFSMRETDPSQTVEKLERAKTAKKETQKENASRSSKNWVRNL